MVHRLCARLAVAALSTLAVPDVSFGETVPADNSLPLFENLLGNGNDIPANLAYAQSLAAAGRPDEARQIYRKVLGLDPNNATARAALDALGAAAPAQPAQTDVTLRWGGAFETNVPRRPPAFSGNSGFVGFGELTVNDIRQLGDVVLQSNFDVYSNANTHFPSVEFSYAAADTGPIFDLGTAGKLRVAIGGEYLLQGTLVDRPYGGSGTRKFTYDAIDAIFNYYPPQPMPLQSVNLLVGYDDFTHDQEFRSGVVLRTTAPMVFPELTPFHTQLIATPGFIYNGAEQPTPGVPRPAHYSEIDVDLLTLTPLATGQFASDMVFGKLGLFADAQWYDSRDPAVSSDRQDQRIIPLAGIRLVNFMGTPVQVDLDYRYDRNFSNDASERFEDHIFSIIGTLRF
ncbi:MAG TPA: tetratricopeptide repeat protein [Stellaceae bacterium]|nr:tetratricopeptide repeat protein [Stellaceae bacterium]